MVFGIYKILKYGITVKFMLSDTTIMGLWHGLICLSEEKLFMKLLFSKEQYAILLTCIFSR